MSTASKTSRVGRRSRSRIGALLGATVFAGSMLIGSTSWLGPSTSGATTMPATGQAQAATCVEATNSEHAEAGRAIEFLIFAFARGSFDYLGLSWATTSLQEGPTGTWTMVESCEGGGADGQAIYQANCAACHGAEGQGGAGPPLQGIGEAHTVEELVQVITNGRGGMPAWQGRLTPEEIDAVATYVSTIPGEHEHDHGGTTTTTAPGSTTTTVPGTTTTTHGDHEH